MYHCKTNIWMSDKHFTFHLDLLVALVLAALSYKAIISLIHNFLSDSISKVLGSGILKY